jgi:peptide/nickel transport system substrate-binding protein
MTARNRPARVLTSTLALLLAVALVSACSAGKPSKQSEAPSAPTGGQTDKPSGPKVLKVAIAVDVGKVDVHMTPQYQDRVTLLNVLEFLIGLDDNGAPAPVLAKDWAWSADGKTLTVNLREGVKFHNGQEMTSKDVKYSLDRVRTQGPRKSEFAQVKEIVAKEKYVVEFQLSEPTSALLGALANPIAPAVIIPEGEVERQGGEITKPVGTGPFMFVEWVPDQYLKVKKFPDYKADDRPASGFAGKREALVDEIIFRPIKEATVRAAALEKGEVDIADEISYQDYTRLKDSPKVTIEMVPSASFGDVRFGFKQGPFANNKKLRQAVMYATNKQEMVDALTWKMGKVANAGLPFFSPFYGEEHQKPVAFDLAKAKQLVKESGYDGREVTISYTLGIWKEMAVVLQAQLAAVGIKAKVDNLEAGSSVAKWNAGSFDIFVSGLTLRPDPMNYYMPFWHSKSTPTGYNNPEYDRLNEEAVRATDNAKRKQLYGELEKLIREDVPWYPLFHITQSQGYRKNVVGYKVWSAGYLRMWNVDLQ